MKNVGKAANVNLGEKPWLFIIIFSACTSEVAKVCQVSDEENLEPFKEKMNDFLTQGKLKPTYTLIGHFIRYLGTLC